MAEEQVHRDHLISHILAALAALDAPVVFFGGTALARTWLTDPANGGRLSEDIDLYTDQRQQVAQLLTQQLPIMLRREFPGSSWQPSLDAVRSSEPARFLSRDGIEVRIQLLSTAHHRELAAWPTDRTTVSLRYADVNDVTLCVPTLTAFAAMKPRHGWTAPPRVTCTTSPHSRDSARSTGKPRAGNRRRTHPSSRSAATGQACTAASTQAWVSSWV